MPAKHRVDDPRTYPGVLSHKQAEVTASPPPPRYLLFGPRERGRDASRRPASRHARRLARATRHRRHDHLLYSHTRYDFAQLCASGCRPTSFSSSAGPPTQKSVSGAAVCSASASRTDGVKLWDNPRGVNGPMRTALVAYGHRQRKSSKPPAVTGLEAPPGFRSGSLLCPYCLNAETEVHSVS